MKCDEIKYEKLGDIIPFYTRSTIVIRKQFVDEAIAELKDEIERLKEERRLRKCSEELPTIDDGYILVLWEDGVPDIGYIGAEEDVIETVRDRGEGHSVEWWMPLPSAPKEG